MKMTSMTPAFDEDEYNADDEDHETPENKQT